MLPIILSCYNCKHYYRNNAFEPRSINGKRIKPFDKYCGHNGRGKKMRRIGMRDKPHKRLHPAWCPLYKEAGSCCVCGKVTYSDEGDTCTTCRNKGF